MARPDSPVVLSPIVESQSINLTSSKSESEASGTKAPRPLSDVTRWSNGGQGPDRPMAPFETFEEALTTVGLFGRYQIFLCLTVQYASILWTGISSFMSLGSMTHDWQCNDKRWNHTIIHGKPVKGSQGCFMVQNCTNLTSINSQFFSIVEQFRLICDEEYVPNLVLVMFFVGRVFGSFNGGHIGDRFGRKKGFFTAQFLLIITSVMAVACTNWKTFLIVQFFNGFYFGIIEVTSLTLLMECTDSKYRLIPNAMFQWSLAYMIVALVAFLTRQWRLYLIIINLIASPLLVAYLLFTESPRWLICRGQLVRAAHVLTDIACDRWNNKNVAIRPEDLERIPRDNKDRVYWFLYLFKTRKLASQSCLQMVSVLTYSLISSNYMYNMDVFPGGSLMKLFYFGLFRTGIPAAVVFLDWKIPRFGRKALFLLSLAIIGFCIMVNIVLLSTGTKSDHLALSIFAILAMVVNSSAFYMAIIQITAVAYPTVLRGIAFGTLHITSDFGYIFIILLVEPLGRLWSYVIPEIFVVLTFFLAFFFQPETKGKSLVDRYEDTQ